MKACWRKAGCTRNCITLSFNSVFHSGRRKVVLAGCGEFFRIGGERYSRLILILDKEGRQDQIIKIASDQEYREQLYREYHI